jgi:protein required for attachment to host cells
MDNLLIPYNALVFIGDGRKALFLRNASNERFPNLKAERVLVDENPPTHEQGSDRPGRAFKRAGTNRRAGMESTDWHELEEHRFTRGVAEAITKLVHEGKVEALIVAAPARTLATLRKAFHADVKSRIIAEIDKDLTKHPITEIEKHITNGIS